MANIFPPASNRLTLQLLVCALSLLVAVSLGVAHYFTPKYTRVGYQPVQPVRFQHDLHANQLGIDCRYCHSSVETAAQANIPTTQTCLNCHSQIQRNSPKLAAVRESWATGEPIPWVRIHAAPDYVYFNHAAHVTRGVSCVSCHGAVNRMDAVYQAQPQSMSWCLDCHRHPETQVRPAEQVFNLDWKPGGPAPVETQEAQGAKRVADWHIHAPLDCNGCHR